MVSVGIDIVELKRFESLMRNETFVQKVFDETELHDDIRLMAGKFAIKEAFFKASQVKINNWNEIVVDIKNNKPSLSIENNIIDTSSEKCVCDLTYDKDYAIGTVILKNQIR